MVVREIVLLQGTVRNSAWYICVSWVNIFMSLLYTRTCFRLEAVIREYSVFLMVVGEASENEDITQVVLSVDIYLFHYLIYSFIYCACVKRKSRSSRVLFSNLL